MSSHDLTQVGYHCNGLEFYERSYTGRDGRPSHTHEETYLIFVLQGTVEEARKRRTFQRTPSTLILLPAGEPHSTQFSGNVQTFEIGLPAPWTERLRPYFSLGERPASSQGGLPMWQMLRLYREFQHPDSTTPLMLEGMLLELVAHISRDAHIGTEKQCPLWLRQARDFLHAHCTENLSLEEVAAEVCVHPAHLTRAFRQRYHCTLGDYVRKLRIEYASHLLTASDTPLAQIALEAGFADQSHFSRTFKSLTGMTPTEFQKISAHARFKQK